MPAHAGAIRSELTTHGVVVLRLSGDVQLTRAASFYRPLHDLPTDARGVAVDVTGVEHCDVYLGLLLMTLSRTLRERHVAFGVLSGTPSCVDGYDVRRFMPFYGSMAEFEAALEPAPH